MKDRLFHVNDEDLTSFISFEFEDKLKKELTTLVRRYVARVLVSEYFTFDYEEEKYKLITSYTFQIEKALTSKILELTPHRDNSLSSALLRETKIEVFKEFLDNLAYGSLERKVNKILC